MYKKQVNRLQTLVACLGRLDELEPVDFRVSEGREALGFVREFIVGELVECTKDLKEKELETGVHWATVDANTLPPLGEGEIRLDTQRAMDQYGGMIKALAVGESE